MFSKTIRICVAVAAASCLIAGHATYAALNATWTTVAMFNGPGGKPLDTAPFTTHGGKVRFLFPVEPNSSGPVPFLSQMFPKGAPVSANELRRTTCVSCDGPQTDDLGNVRAGSYYLHVVTSRPWTLTVQESQ
jgi:hypothetical protein